MQLPSFTDFMKEMRDAPKLLPDSRVMIIDGTNFFIRVFANVPTTTDHGVHVGGITGFLYSLAKIIREHQPTRCFIVFDGTGGSTKRRQVQSSYKEGRKPKGTLARNRAEELEGLEDPEVSYQWQAQRIFEYLKQLPVQVCQYDDVEADDTIAFIWKLFPDSKKIIISADKDFLQFVGEDTIVYNPAMKKLYDVNKVKERFNGLHPMVLGVMRAIDGDAGDNIKGVAGVGLKTLIKHLPQLLEISTHLTPEEFMRMCKDEYAKSKVNSTKSKFLKKLLDHEESIHKLFSITDLRTSKMVSATTASYIGEFVNKSTPFMSPHMIKAYIMQDQMVSAFKSPELMLDSFRTLNAFGQQRNTTIKK